MTSITYAKTNTPSIPQPALSYLGSTGKEIYENIQDRFLFLLEFIKDPFANGSIAPSSLQLTKKMLRYIPKNSETPNPQGRVYLEVGAGTGAFTKIIIERLKPSDHLDVVELNPFYCKKLNSKFKHCQNVHIHCLSITDWNPDYQYDTVISGLPLNGFTPELVEKCLNTFKKLTKAGGKVSYFDYPIFPKLFTKLYWGKKRKNYIKLLDIKNQFFLNYGIHKELVKENFPTANVQHFSLGRQNDETPQVPPLPNTP